VADVIVAPSGIDDVSNERIDLNWRSLASSPVRRASTVASEELVEPPVLEVSLDSSTRPSSAATDVSVIVVPLLEPEEEELLEDDEELEEEELDELDDEELEDELDEEELELDELEDEEELDEDELELDELLELPLLVNSSGPRSGAAPL